MRPAGWLCGGNCIALFINTLFTNALRYLDWKEGQRRDRVAWCRLELAQQLGAASAGMVYEKPPCDLFLFKLELPQLSIRYQ